MLNNFIDMLEVFRKKRALLKVPLHEVPAVTYQTLRGKTCVIDAVVNSLRAVAPPQEVSLLLSDEAIAYSMVLTIIQVVTCDFKSESTRMQRAAGDFAGICPAPHARGVRLVLAPRHMVRLFGFNHASLDGKIGRVHGLSSKSDEKKKNLVPVEFLLDDEARPPCWRLLLARCGSCRSACSTFASTAR